MKKLLHERLREEAKSDCGASCTINNMFVDCEGYKHCADCASECLNRIADEIERYYIPRPRFEDGEPVQFGDDYEQKDAGYISEIAGITVYNDGSYSLRDQHGNDTYTPGNYPAKRPQPKVLDADGVEIKVGDTVWSFDGFKGSAEVVEIRDQIRDVILHHEDDAEFSYCSKHLTHKEPDSLEKLRNEMAEFNCDYLEAASLEERKMSEYVDRLSALIERGA